MDRRREEGLCLRCGRDNCQRSICPFLPAIRPGVKGSTSRTTIERSRKDAKVAIGTKKSRTTMPVRSESEPSEDDMDSENDSEKD